MKPLSFYEYYRGNKRKTLSLITSIAFSILLLGSIHLFLNNTIESAVVYTHQYQHYSVIYNEVDGIGEDQINKISNHSSVKDIIPIERVFVMQQGVIISTQTHSYQMSREDIIKMIDLLDIEFDESKIPTNNSQEMILADVLVKNNDFKKEQDISKELVMNDEMGITFESKMDTDYLIGFIPKTIEEPKSYIIIPEEGKLDEVNSFLNIENDNDYTVITIDNMDSIIEGVMGDINTLFNIVTIIVLISIGIGLGISTYVHYFQRRREFAVLSSMGYSHQSILNRINKEIIMTSFISLTIGFLLLLIEVFLMNELLLRDAGVYLFRIDFGLFTRILIIPLFISVFSLVPTWMLFKRIDPILIIEGVN